MVWTRNTMLAAVMVALVTGTAKAGIIFEVTDIWFGQAGTDLTTDWFELKNSGDMPWINGVSGVLTVNDNSGGTGTDALVQDINDILPGESVIVLMEGDETAKQTFFDVWNPVLPQRLGNIGYAQGSGLGLGSGGDAVNVYLDDVLHDSESYATNLFTPDAASWDVTLGDYSFVGNASGAVATLALGGDNADTPAVGSPISIPEPGTIAMLLVGMAGMAWAGRRN